MKMRQNLLFVSLCHAEYVMRCFVDVVDWIYRVVCTVQVWGRLPRRAQTEPIILGVRRDGANTLPDIVCL